MNVLIEVTAEDLNTEHRCDSSRCAVATAVNRKLKDGLFASVAQDSVNIYEGTDLDDDDCKRLFQASDTPRIMSDVILGVRPYRQN